MIERVKVLYVDDNPLNVKIFDLLLRDDCTLLLATGAVDGLKILHRNQDVQIVFSDFQMPDVNGVEFLHQVKCLYPNTRCYLISAFLGSPEIDAGALKARIDGVLRKPFNKSQLLHLINSVRLNKV